ncbi:hypothetical protein JCM10213_006620 [Rhodosporidiobolus nylandii]
MPPIASATFRPFLDPPSPPPVSTSPSPASPDPPRSLEICAATFYDQASDIHGQVDALKDHLDIIRALSARLYALHPNSLETPTLALDLRDSLLAAAAELKGVDADLSGLWAEEERVRLAVASGTFKLENVAAVGDEEGEIEERREEIDGLVRRFGRRVKEIRREARGEKRDRKSDGERDEPGKLEDYLEPGVHDFPHLLTKDTVHASRWVVSNPFTILVRLCDGLKALSIPAMVSAKATPSTFRRLTPPPLYPVSSSSSASVQAFDGGILHVRSPPPSLVDSPTPAGTGDGSKPMPGWKQAILAEADARKAQRKEGRSKRFFDEVAQDGEEGWREISVATGRGHRERWIIFLTLALFPILLVLNFVENWLLSSRSSSFSSSSASPTASSSLGLRAIAPTMLPDGGEESGSGTAISTGQAELRERRRRSLEMDGEVV